MNRVFVFGAGASKDAGGPLIRDFMLQGMFYLCNQDAYNEITTSSFRAVFELVDLLYGTSLITELNEAMKQGLCHIESTNILKDVSVEDILSFIDLGLAHKAASEYPSLDYQSYKKALDDFIFETIQLETTHSDSFSTNTDGTINHSRNLYDMLVDYGLNICDRNSFITLNYDLLLDRALAINNHRLRGDYRVPFIHVSNFNGYERILRNKRLPCDVDILKLHGSLNWAVCPNCNAPHLAYFWQYTRLPQEHCSLCQALLAPVLVSPAYRKEIGKYSFLAEVWLKAQEVINEADEISIIGYSFPDADIETKWLFKKALLGRANRPRLFVIEPEPTVREKIRAFFLDTVEICNECENFTEYCKKIGCYREQPPFSYP
jgi:NAD-dependent SIR2 family protein deacetylase